MSKKNLPYFKWNPITWNSGDIQICSYVAKGIFCDIKADYWIKECIMSYEFIQKKWDKPVEVEAIKELIKNEVIKIKRGMVIIEFMLEQRNDITGTSKKNSVNGKKGAEKRWNNGKGNNQDPEIKKNPAPSSGSFFYIGMEMFKYPVSEYIKTEFQIHLNSFMPTMLPIKLEDILIQMDSVSNGKVFNNHSHVKNTFNQIARDMKSGTHKKSFNNPTASRTTLNFGK